MEPHGGQQWGRAGPGAGGGKVTARCPSQSEHSERVLTRCVRLGRQCFPENRGRPAESNLPQAPFHVHSPLHQPHHPPPLPCRQSAQVAARAWWTPSSEFNPFMYWVPQDTVPPVSRARKMAVPTVIAGQVKHIRTTVEQPPPGILQVLDHSRPNPGRAGQGNTCPHPHAQPQLRSRLYLGMPPRPWKVLLRTPK